VKPGILMVTGAYWPELSGGGLQCRTIINSLRDRFDFMVLTTCTDPGLPTDDRVDGVAVTRVLVSVGKISSKIAAAFQTVNFLLRAAPHLQAVHLHGFSQKSILITILARLLGKRVIVTLHTAGQDDPEGVRRAGQVSYWAYRKADRFIAISHLMADAYRAAGLPENRLRIAPNGIDTSRFSPSSATERRQMRAALGLPEEVPVVLFVGFFSRDKRPDVLYQAWRELRERHGITTVLLFAGATQSDYFEVDSALKAEMEADAKARNVERCLRFAGEVRDVERYYRAADVFVMPSTREAFGMALLEGMSSALPVIATRIPGVTDGIVEHQRTGVLVPGEHPIAIADALRDILNDRTASAAMGAAARADVEARFGLPVARERWAAIYEELVQR